MHRPARRFPAALLLSLASALAAAALVPAPAHAQWQANGVPVCTAAGDQTLPAVAPDFNGGAYIVWQDARSGTPRIYAQHLDALGVPLWTAGGITVSTVAGAQTAPVAIGDGAGGVYIAWVQNVGVGNDDIYAQRLNSAGSPLWSTAGAVVCWAAGVQNQIAMISDGRLSIVANPGPILVWTDGRNGSATDIYMQALDNTGGARFAANGVVVCDAPGAQSTPAMVTDGVVTVQTNPRGAIVAWRDERVTAGFGDIYCQRVSAGGVIQWITNGIGVATDAAEEKTPRLLALGGGAAIVAWAGPGPSRTFKIYAQRVANNAVGWAAGGVQICPDGGRQANPVLVGDFAGGAMVAFEDSRGLTPFDVYLQRVSATGTLRFPTTGVQACTAPGGKGSTALVIGRSGTCVAAWADVRTGATGIYAQQLDTLGTRRWAPEALPLSTISVSPTGTVAIPDTSGGAIVAWTDYRNGTADIYANCIRGWGGAVAVDPAPGGGNGAGGGAGGLRLAAPRPNPSAGGASMALRFELATGGPVTARVLDVHGRLVRTLARDLACPVGPSELRWDGRDAGGTAVPAGLYFVEVASGAETRAQRAVILR